MVNVKLNSVLFSKQSRIRKLRSCDGCNVFISHFTVKEVDWNKGKRENLFKFGADHTEYSLPSIFQAKGK